MNQYTGSATIRHAREIPPLRAADAATALDQRVAGLCDRIERRMNKITLREQQIAARGNVEYWTASAAMIRDYRKEIDAETAGIARDRAELALLKTCRLALDALAAEERRVTKGA